MNILSFREKINESIGVRCAVLAGYHARHRPGLSSAESSSCLRVLSGMRPVLAR